jgi:DNA-binding transcriptional MerR regulator
MTYTPIGRIAEKLGTDAATLYHFRKLGWISSVERGQTEYLESHQEYKAKFILYLQKERGLNSRQIGSILAEQKPPYSAAKVDLKFPEAGAVNQVH